MSRKIFINYRREDSMGIAGRLHDRLVQAFGRNNIFMDVDHIPAGVDFVAHLSNQVGACNVVLVVIGPHWLDAKDEAGQHRINQKDDFVAIEIATALARDIRVIPVLVDGASIPKPIDLPDSLKPLARRQAIEVRQTHFGRDAEALVERIGEALGYGLATPGRWRARTFGALAAAVLTLFGIGVGSYILSTAVRQSNQQEKIQAEPKRQAEQAQEEAQAEAKRQAEQAQQEARAEAQQEAQAEAKRQAEQAQHEAQAEAKRQAEQAQAEAKRQAEQAQQEARAEAKRQAEQAQQEARAESKRQTEQAQQEAQTEAKRQADKENSALSSSWIGVRIHAVTGEIAEGLNIKPPRGALVVGLANGPARAGGILVGDVLLKFDGHDIKEIHDLPLLVTGTAIGQRVEIVLSRRGNKETHTVTIGRLNDGR